MISLTILVLSFGVFAHAAPAANSPEEVRPLMVGQIIPSASIRTLSGAKTDLASVVRGRHSVLVFYRGGWCPYCGRQLAALGAAKESLKRLGWEIVAVSPDAPVELAKSKGKHELDYELFSDSKGEASRAMGLAFTVDERTLETYKGFGIDLERSSGERHHELPVPAVYLVGPDGTALFQYVNPNYKIRLDPKLLIAAAEIYGPPKQ
ncbi:MAG: hypothetical protein AUJ52_10180 [Elusimicrobia bacterium CG1_02_63_36]|nr:MAG: hypothetical protein AUJ52_10180 [Elusimicrobia bacterium CG1_02_63_36]PIP81897.1 MAG: antioxidant AhpC [Elusimicrobia bacterium CG22_combo_CG10-13_8_21_14_all_63_91]PJA15038.1 MAG: antioxidant AhpC [Elusimicrobia bacterium CG_4_10_14_0_2_um_filter_63_34]PJB27119.1 MAG: antioxidant AhpC [Elusimicrobia bacterium CG_4_9_14_3_um_filter_62_55]